MTKAMIITHAFAKLVTVFKHSVVCLFGLFLSRTSGIALFFFIKGNTPSHVSTNLYYNTKNLNVYIYLKNVFSVCAK